MQFRSEQTRSIWINATLGSAIDAAVAYGISNIWGNGELAATALIFLAMQAIYLAIWFKRTVVMWLHFLLIGRRKMRRHMGDFLRENGFPEPEPYYDSVDDYLSRIVQDDRLKADTRIKAAAELATINALPVFGLVQFSLQLRMAFEDAIKRYKRSFPQGSTDDGERQ